MSTQSMGTIKENINYILESQRNMGYHMPTIINSPASDKEIIEAERNIGMIFNDELKDLFKTINGIDIDGETPSGLTGIIPIHELLSLKGAISYSNNMDWNEHKEMYEIEYEFGSNLFPFIHDGAGNCYWVDLNEGTNNYGRLYWTNTFGDEPDYLFNSLTEFFEAVKIGYEKGIYTLDKEGYLNSDYKEWSKICHELDKSISYWNEYAN